MTPLPAPVVGYRNVMNRITRLVADVDDDDARRPVPATPLWTVCDVLAHLTGVCDDAVHGRLDDAPSDAWTAAQVEPRRGRTITELVTEWEALWPEFSPLLAYLATAESFLAGQAVIDVLTHEQDLRWALGEPPTLDPVAWPVALAIALRMIGDRRDGRGVGALTIHTAEGPLVAGTGAPSATVEVTPYELCRAVTGRRSRDQIGAWRWEGDWRLDDLCFFPPRATDLVESTAAPGDDPAFRPVPQHQGRRPSS